MTALNTDDFYIPALSAQQIKQRFGVKKLMVGYFHTDEKNQTHIFFIDFGDDQVSKTRSVLMNYPDIWVKESMIQTRSAVAPRKGCLDGNVDSLEKWIAVFHPGIHLVTSSADILKICQKSLQAQVPLSLEEALIARLPEVSDLKAYLLENNILRNPASSLNYFLKSDVLIDDVLIFCLKLSKHFGDPETYWTNIHTANRLFLLQTDKDFSNNLNKVIVR